MSRPLTVLDLFSCIGAHKLGFDMAGPYTTTCFVEIRPERRAILSRRFPGIPQHDDVNTYSAKPRQADIVVGGPPCQRTSVAAAISGRRDGASLWPAMLNICNIVAPEWIVVEQPPGNAAWEATVARDLAESGFHSARSEFSAFDLGAPHQRRRVFILAHRDLSRLEITWRSIPQEIDRVARGTAAGNAWCPDHAGALRVASGPADRLDRRQRIEAIGDSNPPAMMAVIGRAILNAEATP